MLTLLAILLVLAIILCFVLADRLVDSTEKLAWAMVEIEDLTAKCEAYRVSFKRTVQAEQNSHPNIIDLADYRRF